MVVAALTLALLCACTYTASTKLIFPEPRLDEKGEPIQPKPDSEFYYNIVERVRGGQRYHDAAKEEFDRPYWRDDGWRPTSIFNWRTPTYAWMLAALPSQAAGMLCVSLLALVSMALWFRVIQQSQGPLPSLLVALLVGPFGWCISQANVYLFTELWAGILIAMSIALYALNRWPLAVLAALAALFLRELTLPYCLLCLVLAVWQRRPREVAAWVLGLGLYVAFYGWHVHQVRIQIAGEEAVAPQSWIRFGGLAFAIATTQLGNLFLTALPSVFAGFMLPFALLGLAGWRGDTGIRAGLTCAGYLTFFLIAGKPQQAYWGLMISPLLALGLAALPNVFRDLGNAIFGTIGSAGAKIDVENASSESTDKVTG
jgi:hypothetical protein